MEGKELVKVKDIGDMVCMRDARGALQSYSALMNLYEAEGEICKAGDGYMITAAGYANKLNRVANLTIIVPQLDGGNPRITRDPKTRAADLIHVTKIAFGPAPMGNMVASYGTVDFPIHTYFLQGLLGLVKKHPACGRIGDESKPPKGIVKQEVIVDWKESKSGKRFPVKEMQDVDYSKCDFSFYPIEGPVGVWIDLNHPEVPAAFSNLIELQRFGERRAATIAERIAFSKHPSMPPAKVKLTTPGCAQVRVYGYRHAIDVQGLSDIGEAIQRGDVTGGKVSVGGAPVETIKAEPETVEASFDEEVQASQEEAGADGEQQDGPSMEETAALELSEAKDALTLAAKEAGFSEGKVDEVLTRCKIELKCTADYWRAVEVINMEPRETKKGKQSGLPLK